ncbi:hypothetical protein M422DRAFT_271055 [Sphaerobolus stellatus SS14]|uniref:Uncharacterized protein n=1 Tax=Sphaerobolus stellatus (strain SS14) TaxID=990650 RepID=A0A0C9U111_SPHS4|nr:hypothetical protein M422DRAFT_271055 [Sphaerobolus stellatus SS14]
MGDLTNPHQLSVDPQQTTEVFTPEHPSDQNMRAHSPQTVPVQVQSPIGAAGTASTSMPGLCPFEVDRLHEEYADMINLKDNAEIVLTEPPASSLQPLASSL